MNQKKNPNHLYNLTSLKSEKSFWGEIPRSFGEAVDLVISNYSQDRKDGKKDKIDKLKKFLVKFHTDLGIISPKTIENIGKIENGSVLMGQQPIIFGGPGFIGNKVGCLLALDEMFKSRNFELAPVFFIGDYDGLQKELTRQYFPNPISHHAYILDSGDYLPEESSIAAHAARLPPVEWLYEEIEKLEDNFRGFKKQVKGPSKKLLEERWNHIKTIMKNSFLRSETLSEWATTMWGIITNVINDFGIVYLPTSHPELRELIADQFHVFIDQRKTYTQVFKQSMNELENMGYQPTLPHRHEDYAPFTLECKEDMNRITTNLVFKDDSIFAEGECPECKIYYSYDVSTVENIQKIAKIIGPRVDTSQAIFQDLMNIRLRISGPGEIAYYAVVAPAVKAIGFELPVFVKYKRAFYNSPWNEKLGKLLLTRKQGAIHQNELFDLLRERVEGIKSENTAMIQEAELGLQNFIQKVYKQLLEGKQSIDTQKYLGWQYGRFTKHKYGQEVSWIWFDMAIQTGLNDYLQSYKRMYLKDSLLGSLYFINSMI